MDSWSSTSSILVSLLMEYLEPGVGVESVVKLLELPERCSVVLGGTLRKDIDTEVSLVDLVVVLLLVFRRHLLALLLQVHL